MITMRNLFFFIMILKSSQAYAEINFDNLEWQLKKKSHQIEIFTSKVPGSKFVSVKGETYVQTSLSSLVALVLDAEVCPEWVHLCKESHIHKRISDNELYLYTATNPPWPIKNRDVLVHVNISQHPEDHSVVIKGIATKDIIPHRKGYLRITESISIWKFIPISNQEIQIEVYSHVDPGGGIPAWLNNILITKTPYLSLKKMRKLAESGKYDNHQLPYIKQAPNQSF